MVSSTGGEASFPSHALTFDMTMPLAADPVKALVLSLQCVLMWWCSYLY
jgi:hypothetical protein